METSGSSSSSSDYVDSSYVKKAEYQEYLDDWVVPNGLGGTKNIKVPMRLHDDMEFGDYN